MCLFKNRNSAFKSFLFYVYGCFSCIYMCAPCKGLIYKGQKREMDLLGLELQLVMSCHEGASNWT